MLVSSTQKEQILFYTLINFEKSVVVQIKPRALNMLSKPSVLN